jgi:uncharacterized protein
MPGKRGVYLDSSALVKLVVREAESAALGRFLRRYPRRISCGLARTEVPRAVRDHGPAALQRARRLLQRIDLIRLEDSLLDSAGRLDPRVLRSLDAIHLAAAELVRPDVDGVVTYDGRMTEAAVLLEFAVYRPGVDPPDQTPAG